jgi:hypothetical protein
LSSTRPPNSSVTLDGSSKQVLCKTSQAKAIAFASICRAREAAPTKAHDVIICAPSLIPVTLRRVPFRIFYRHKTIISAESAELVQILWNPANCAAVAKLAVEKVICDRWTFEDDRASTPGSNNLSLCWHAWKLVNKDSGKPNCSVVLKVVLGVIPFS